VKEAVTEGNNVSWAYKTYGDATKLPLGRIMIRKLNGMGARSWPDRMFIGVLAAKQPSPLQRRLGAVAVLPEARVWLIEYKRAGKLPEPGQENHIKALRRLGIRTYLVDNANEGRRIITAEMEGLIPSGYWSDGSALAGARV
jgi:hypothetical protein